METTTRLTDSPLAGFRTDDPRMAALVELLISEAGADGKCPRRMHEYVRDVNPDVFDAGYDPHFDDRAVMVALRGLIECPSEHHEPRVLGLDADGIVSKPVELDDTPAEPAPQRAAKPREKTPAAGSGSGGGQVPWRVPVNQAEHAKMIRDSRTLKGNARLVAYDAHLQIGVTGAATGVPFERVKRELAPEYLAGVTGLSESTARRAMQEACRLGFYVRIDNGKGGRNRSNKATYSPTVPNFDR